MTTRCGYVGLIGRPNVGKSTLMNALVGEKVSIVTSHPQTTRHVVRGIVTHEDTQIVFVDTPGIHERARHALNRRLNRAALAASSDVDLNLFVIEAGQWRSEDQRVLDGLVMHDIPIGLVVNKIDKVSPREKLLPMLAEHAQRHDFAFVVPLCARRSDNLAALSGEIGRFLPESPFMFGADMIMDRSEAFYVSELVREKLVSRMRDELPFSLACEVESDQIEGGLRSVSVIILVSRESQKGIVVGKGGIRLKEAGADVRKELEERWGDKVFLRLWVKLRKNWNDDERSLDRLGIDGA